VLAVRHSRGRAMNVFVIIMVVVINVLVIASFRGSERF
jgi:hypothetical protein